MRTLWLLILVLLAGGAIAFVVARRTESLPTDSEGIARLGVGADGKPVVLPPSAPAPVPKPAPKAEPVDFNQDLTNAIEKATGALTPSASAPQPGQGTPVDLPFSAEYPRDKVIPAKAEKFGDRKLLIDGLYEITGAGTKADPYLVPFDVLVSAANTFDPRKGLARLPQRVTFLNDKFVKITGYIAFPISSTDPKEALVMLNQWDGCCIGVPPTAYDAIEIKLAKPAAGDDRFITHGSLTGLFKVSPYTDGGWLLGLYLMEDGVLKGDETDPTIKKRHESQ